MSSGLTRRQGLAALAIGGLATAGGVHAAAPPPDTLAGLRLRADQIDLLLRTLADADGQGLPAATFHDPRLEALLASIDPIQRATGERMLIANSLAYARTVRAGRLTASRFPYVWGLRPAAYDPTPEFIAAAREFRLTAWLDTLQPPYVGYDGLRTGLSNYRALLARGGWAALPAGSDLAQGAGGARVAALRARLAAEDFAVDPQGPPVLDEPLAQAVIRAQRRYGLAPTGIVDRDTAASLDVSIERRIDQILANLERWRWMPRTMPDYRIQVNVAAAVLTVFERDQPVMSMRAATGAPGHETPMLSSTIRSMVFNPPWNVPTSIADAELWPRERASPGFLRRNGYVVNGRNIQQPAGPRSALGKIKFDFENPYAVYLHDTPSRGAFADYDRLISHGCVRLERPQDLARALTEADTVWTRARVDAAYAASATVRASLQRPAAVYLLYWTAFMGTDGMMNFRDDPYGWDSELMRRLAA